MIAACLITRDGAQTLERCIASLRPFVDEVCVFLAGESTDGTPEILERLAAEPGAPILVEQGEWRRDYACARNQAARMASSEWIIWAEDDEVLEGGRDLRPSLVHTPVACLWVQRLEIETTDFVRTWWCPRVVRAELAHWQCPVHETLMPTLVAAGARFHAAKPNRLRVIHHPVAQLGRHRHRGLVEEVLGRGEWETVLASFAARYVMLEDRDYARAAQMFRAIINRPEPRPAHELGHLSSVWRDLGYCARKLGDWETCVEAAAACWLVTEEFLRRDPFARYRAFFNEAYPIADDDPLWTTYCDDPRTPPEPAQDGPHANTREIVHGFECPMGDENTLYRHSRQSEAAMSDRLQREATGDEHSDARPPQVPSRFL